VNGLTEEAIRDLVKALTNLVVVITKKVKDAK
jgi:phenylpyruvate tautomerase PptA (4-oxalocrotonate tautomerase family)